MFSRLIFQLLVYQCCLKVNVVFSLNMSFLIFQSAEGKVSEYEQQLAALLNNLEERQSETDKQNNELHETRVREKELLAKQRRLEEKCKEQSEQIHNLSVNLSKASLSTSDIPGALRHSTPMRNATSSYFHGKNDEEDSENEDSDVRPFQQSINISHVAPMTRSKISTSSVHTNESDSLLKNDRGVHSSESDHKNYNTAPVTKNYYNTSLKRSDSAFENVGVVHPNNSRTVVDVEFPESSSTPLTLQKRKKKGLMRVFKLCTGGKSGQPMARQESMYHKRPAARVTVDTAPRE